MDGVEQPDQAQQMSAEERLAAQAKEIQDLREQLARVAVKEGPRLPPLSVPEINRALEKPQLAQWMRLMLSNIKAYVRLRAGEVGEIPRPSEFGGQSTEAAVDPGEQLAWRVWDCVSESQAAYARRYAGSLGKSNSESNQYATLEEAWRALGLAFTWRSVKFREVGGVLQWQSRQGEWIPVESPPSGGCQRCAQRGSPDERHWHFRCPHWSGSAGARTSRPGLWHHRHRGRAAGNRPQVGDSSAGRRPMFPRRKRSAIAETEDPVAVCVAASSIGRLRGAHGPA